eukprot:TRINITY_DN63022_c0_g1_i1.p1 TRINITY_DN63022_c0_g1~~TRINITY_DN63022_c0_g1_i1.p1  ORF type:complete len:526 (-),score=88.80 TRINITY_DN63022_c0_g1_i1:11-1588(-)
MLTPLVSRVRGRLQAACSRHRLAAGTARTDLQHLPESIPWSSLNADGVTPWPGVVLSNRDFGVIVALSRSQHGLVAADEIEKGSADKVVNARGNPVTVYIKRKSQDTRRMKLSFQAGDSPVQRLDRLICDGRHPYDGVVTSVASFGIFVDIGFERPGFLPSRSLPVDAPIPQLGETLTVYATQRRWRNGRFELSLQPLEAPRLMLEQLAADGRTPYQGVVKAVVDGVAVIDIGFEVEGTLLVPGESEQHELHPGKGLTVYVTRRMRRARRIFLSKVPRLRPLISFDDVVADGQTPHVGTVLGGPHGDGFFLVDIGCEDVACLPASDPRVQAASEGAMPPLVMGEKLASVYVQAKQHFNGTLIVSTVRRHAPRERMSAVAADGVTSYEGIVTKRTSWGTFLDIGCEAPGLLLAGKEQSTKDATGPGGTALLCPRANVEEVLPTGSTASVYVWHKSIPSGRIYVGLDPRPHPAIRIDELPVDGVTELTGTVTKVSDKGAFVDVGCELLGLISRKEMDVEEGDRKAHV